MILLDRRGDALYLDLFNQASLVNFAVKDAKGSNSQALSLIARSDTAEVALRRLASYVHGKRTGDRDAAVPMLLPTCLMTLLRHGWCQRQLFLLKVSIRGASGPKHNEAMLRAPVVKQRACRKEVVTNAPKAARRPQPLRVEVLVALLGPLSAPGG